MSDDIYLPPPDDMPDLPQHVKYRFSGGDEIGSARCAGCRRRWSKSDEKSFVEWYREHAACAELLPPSTSG